MEIFVAYTKDSLLSDLTKTLEAWEKVPGAEPVAIEVPDKKYELIRRVTAENMSEGDYILADLGCLPENSDVVKDVRHLLGNSSKIGMVEFSPHGCVRACRKGIVERWPQNKSGLYQKEHEQAYLTEGYTVPKWPTLQYRRLAVH